MGHRVAGQRLEGRNGRWRPPDQRHQQGQGIRGRGGRERRALVWRSRRRTQPAADQHHLRGGQRRLQRPAGARSGRLRPRAVVATHEHPHAEWRIAIGLPRVRRQHGKRRPPADQQLPALVQQPRVQVVDAPHARRHGHRTSRARLGRHRVACLVLFYYLHVVLQLKHQMYIDQFPFA